MEKAKEICQEIKAYFARKGIKINEAAERLGVAPQSVTSQLSGRTFGRNLAEHYAEVFGFNANYLRTGEGTLLPETPDVLQEPGGGEVKQLVSIIESQQRTIEELVHKLG